MSHGTKDEREKDTGLEGKPSISQAHSGEVLDRGSVGQESSVYEARMKKSVGNGVDLLAKYASLIRDVPSTDVDIPMASHSLAFPARGRDEDDEMPDLVDEISAPGQDVISSVVDINGVADTNCTSTPLVLQPNEVLIIAPALLHSHSTSNNVELLGSHFLSRKDDV